jgi:hypothetical protein
MTAELVAPGAVLLAIEDTGGLEIGDEGMTLLVLSPGLKTIIELEATEELKAGGELGRENEVMTEDDALELLDDAAEVDTDGGELAAEEVELAPEDEGLGDTSAELDVRGAELAVDISDTAEDTNAAEETELATHDAELLPDAMLDTDVAVLVQGGKVAADHELLVLGLD